MKPKILIGILIALIAINIATIGGYVYFRFIRNGPPGRSWSSHDRSHYRGHDHHPKLDLTPAQKDSLSKLLKIFFTETSTQRDSIHSLEVRTFKLLQHDPIPNDQINANLQKIFRLRFEVSKKIIGKLVDAKSFLSREQQQKFYNAIMMVHPERRPPPPDSTKNPSKQ